MNVKIVLLLALVALAEAQRRPFGRPGRGGRGGKGDRKGKFFDESCKPECEDGSKSFALMVSDDTDCPTDFSDKQALRGTFAKPWEFCAAENTRMCGYCAAFDEEDMKPTVTLAQTCSINKPDPCTLKALRNATCTC